MTYLALQTALKAAGYDPGPLDDKWGKSTLAALMAYGAGKQISPVIREAAASLVGAMIGKDITTPLRIVHFLAQMAHESGGFTRLQENLNYSATRLMAVWPKRFTTLAQAQRVANGGPTAIAEFVYGNRASLGNMQPGDGAAYIGRGFTMITGRENYKTYGDLIGLNLIDHPEQAAAPDVAGRIAVAFWDRHNLNALADRDDIVAITAIVNGGQNGIDDRKAILARLKLAWGL